MSRPHYPSLHQQEGLLGLAYPETISKAEVYSLQRFVFPTKQQSFENKRKNCEVIFSWEFCFFIYTEEVEVGY